MNPNSHPLQAQAMEETWLSYEKMIYQISHKIAAQFKFPFEDVLSFATLCFVKGFPKFNPERSSISTFLYMYVSLQVRQCLRKEIRNNKIQYSELEDYHFAELEAPNPFWLVEFKDKLCEESKLVVDMLIDMPEELEAFLQETKPKNKTQYKKALVKFLVDNGWSKNLVMETFDEIKAFLSL